VPTGRCSSLFLKEAKLLAKLFGRVPTDR